MKNINLLGWTFLVGLTLFSIAPAYADAAPEVVPDAVKYTIVFEDEKGVSHFRDGEVPLTLQNYAPPALPLAASAVEGASGVIFLSVPPGWFGDWHPAPRRQYIFCLSGEAEVEVGDGEKRRVKPGDLLFVEDVNGVGHTTRAVGGGEFSVCGGARAQVN